MLGVVVGCSAVRGAADGTQKIDCLYQFLVGPAYVIGMGHVWVCSDLLVLPALRSGWRGFQGTRSFGGLGGDCDTRVCWFECLRAWDTGKGEAEGPCLREQVAVPVIIVVPRGSPSDALELCWSLVEKPFFPK